MKLFIKKYFLPILGLVALLYAHSTRADPVNFMVGDLTFRRPENWAWVTPEGTETNAAAKLKITQLQKNGEIRDLAWVLFYQEPTTLDATMKTWSGYFVSSNGKPTSKTEHKKIEDYKLTWVTIDGSRLIRGKPYPNYSLVGVIIEKNNEKRIIHIRILAGTAVVNGITSQLRKVVLDALNEKNAY